MKIALIQTPLPHTREVPRWAVDKERKEEDPNPDEDSWMYIFFFLNLHFSHYKIVEGAVEGAVTCQGPSHGRRRLRIDGKWWWWWWVVWGGTLRWMEMKYANVGAATERVNVASSPFCLCWLRAIKAALICWRLHTGAGCTTQLICLSAAFNDGGWGESWKPRDIANSSGYVPC